MMNIPWAANILLQNFLKSKRMSVNEYFTELVNSVGKTILLYSPQLYIIRNNIEPVHPRPYASSVLLMVEDKYFLLSAGHALSNVDPKNIGVMIDNTFIVLEGDVKYVDPGLNKTNDKIDLAIWQLTKPVVADIKTKHKFLDICQIEIEHVVTKHPQYIIAGFPAETSLLQLTTSKINVTPFIFLTDVTQKSTYHELDYDERVNLILNYNHTQIFKFGSESIEQGPDAHGVSGSGLWYLPKLILNDFTNIPFKLVGIVIEWHDIRHYLIATRIHLVTELIRTYFKIPVPASNIMTVK